MSIWGSLLGGMVGFSFGGPIGALIGSMIGGRLSSSRRGGFRQGFAQQQQIFAISLIILTAKLAKVDGHVSKEELIAVKEKLKIPEHEFDQVGKIFNKAKEDSLGYESYAQQIAQLHKRNPAALDEVINILFYIAEADGKVSDSEINYIKNDIYNAKQLKNISNTWIKKSSNVLSSRTAMELRGISCIDLEIQDSKRKSCVVSRSFGKRISLLKDIREAVSTYISRAAEKIRNEKLVANNINLYIRTSPFNRKSEEYRAS